MLHKWLKRIFLKINISFFKNKKSFYLSLKNERKLFSKRICIKFCNCISSSWYCTFESLINDSVSELDVLQPINPWPLITPQTRFAKYNDRCAARFSGLSRSWRASRRLCRRGTRAPIVSRHSRHIVRHTVGSIYSKGTLVSLRQIRQKGEIKEWEEYLSSLSFRGIKSDSSEPIYFNT